MLKINKTHLTFIGLFLIGSALLLAILHLMLVQASLANPDHAMSAYTKLFDLDSEKNVPTFYNSFLLLLAAILAIWLAFKLKVRRAAWLVLAASFVILSIDEAYMIHERLSEPIRDKLTITDGSPFFHAWVVVAIPAALLLITLLVVGWRKRHQIMDQAALKVVLTLLAMVIGSVTMEIIGTQLYSNQNLYRLLIVPLEEVIEISGSSAVVYLIMSSIQQAKPRRAKNRSSKPLLARKNPNRQTN